MRFSAAIIAAIFHFAAAYCHCVTPRLPLPYYADAAVSFDAICFELAFAAFAIDDADADADAAMMLMMPPLIFHYFHYYFAIFHFRHFS
jgi:hypothetical protein